MTDIKRIDEIKNRIKKYLLDSNKKPEITSKAINRFVERAEKIRRLASEADIRRVEIKSKIVIVDASKIAALQPTKQEVIKKEDEWEKYEELKKRALSKRNKENLIEALRAIKGKGFNSQRLELLYRNIEFKGLEGIDLAYNLFVTIGIKDLKEIFRLVVEEIETIIYRVATDRMRVLRH